LIQFVITKALPYIFNSLGYGTWFFFASWMLLATIWSFFFLPETKGKTLDEMDTILYVPLRGNMVLANESVVISSAILSPESRVRVRFEKMMLLNVMWRLSSPVFLVHDY
jgi:tellurite resistance protein TehA-like permease